ncbi:MAG: nuclear transport factor 2 family protein [Thermoleophilia bacterium]|nr:nuclear transport factor 2 family protein [Thermoleophilia bacterium]MDH3724819.1 nuclear transport factor 2 family protein [Thermoleophilia bacterium]
MPTATTFDFELLREAIEQANESSLVGFYADDAEMQVIDKDRPPGSPLVLHGKSEIGELYRDICSRAMTHEVQDPVLTPDRVAFNEACRYPDGLRVLSANTLDLHGGKIVRHRLVQAWDEA